MKKRAILPLSKQEKKDHIDLLNLYLGLFLHDGNTLVLSVTCVCSCSLCVCSSVLRTGSWQTSQSAMFLRQWISCVVKLASGMSCLLKKKNDLESLYWAVTP